MKPQAKSDRRSVTGGGESWRFGRCRTRNAPSTGPPRLATFRAASKNGSFRPNTKYDRTVIPENLPGHLRQLGGVSLFSRHNGRWLATLWSLHDFCRPPARPCQRRAGGAKPPKATAKPYSRHILGIYSGVQSHPKATPKPTARQPIGNPVRPQSHLKATPKPPSCDPQATSKPAVNLLGLRDGRGSGVRIAPKRG